MTDTGGDLLNTNEAAEYLGCSPYTIRYRVTNKTLTPARMYGPSYVFSRSDLDRHIAEYPIRETGARVLR